MALSSNINGKWYSLVLRHTVSFRCFTAVLARARSYCSTPCGIYRVSEVEKASRSHLTNTARPEQFFT